MRHQISFAQAEYDAKRKTTRRDRFLAEMEQIVPRDRLLDELRPFYYAETDRGRGRPPIALERMLRMYFLQQWFGLADEALEDAIDDSQAFRGFLGIDLGRASVPDATTLLRFRRLLEDNALGERLFATIKELMRERGLLLEKGTLVDATIIEAPSSTKHKDKARDPEMHQTRKGKQWHFGAKAHIGADAHSGVVHTVAVTAANVADVVMTGELLHGNEDDVYADAGYIGAEKRDELKDLDVTWNTAEKRSKITAMEDGPLKDLSKRAEQIKARIRARVEHPFHVVKDLFGHRKLRYRGLKKNRVQSQVMFALANLVITKKTLLA